MKTKKISKIFAIVLSVFGVLFLCFYFLFLHHYSGKEIIYSWKQTDQFEIQKIKTIEKKKDKNFVILNLADLQMCDVEDFFNFGIIRNEIAYLIKKTQPDLITLTGDQTWSNENLISLTRILNYLNSFKIPYAPIFGNHDYGNEKNSAVASVNFCCDLYENSKYCLFDRGPSNLGSLGNYVINIVEEGKIFKTLYMIDSGYENKISDQQIAWMKWNAEGIRAANGGEYSSSMCFMHKPIPEYASAYYGYLYGSSSVEAIGDVYVNYSLFGSLQNGFFEQAKDIGITDIVCGHQHGNNFTLKYEGVRLTFALKTGELGGYYDDGIVNLNGATEFILHDDDSVEIENIFVDRNSFKIKPSNNVYLN